MSRDLRFFVRGTPLGLFAALEELAMAWFRKPKYTTLRPAGPRSRIPEGMWHKCDQCMEIVTSREWEEREKVCPRCGHHERITARERIAYLLDSGSFQEYDSGLVSGDPLQFVDSKPYPDRIREAQKKTGERDAVIWGTGRIHGRVISLAVMDFNFNGGSLGSVAGEKISRSLERGLELKVPVLTICASGGARMQEGPFSLMQLAKTSALIGRLGKARLPYFVLLTDPSMAGVMASYGSLGDVIVAEPNALIGFAGPRVVEATIKQILPQGFQRSEFVLDHGFLDIVAPRYELRDLFAGLVNLLTPEEYLHAGAIGGPEPLHIPADDKNLQTAGVQVPDELGRINAG